MPGQRAEGDVPEPDPPINRGHAHQCEHCPGGHTGELPCLASATTKARTWLLIEHPGPWPERIEQLAAPAAIAETVVAAQRAGVRPQLIRRPGRRRDAAPAQVFTGRSIGGLVRMEGRALADPAELAELDLDALAAGRDPGFGEPVDGPVLLVCAHGRRNVCCARSGTPLARGLAAEFGAAVWETSHVGGDRFAANLVCLPHGLYYGAVDLPAATAAVRAYRRGEIVLDRFRGRAGLSEPAQAAEHFVREHTGIAAVDAVTVRTVTGAGPYKAVVEARGARYRVTVQRAPVTDPCVPGCGENLDTYVNGGLALLNGAALV